MTGPRLVRKFAWAACIALSLLSPVAVGQQKDTTAPKRVANVDEIARNARRLYYNLRSAGLVRYQCSFNMDWDALFKQFKSPGPEMQARFEKLKTVKYQFSLGAANDVQLTHSEIPVSTEQEQRAMYQIYSGTDQMVRGFFQSWSEFMLHNPFDNLTSKDIVTDDGEVFRVESDVSGAHTVLMFGKDYVLRELQAKTVEFSGTVQPKFTSGENGFILRSFSAVYKTPNGPESHLTTDINYQSVSGFQLPKKVVLDVVTGEQRIPISFEFDNCSAEKP